MSLSHRIVYLDLNHFINLAKQEKAGDDILFNRIKALADNGKVIFPISVTHIMEIASISKPAQRSNLSEIIDSISRGYILRSFEEMMFLEVLNVTAEFYGKNRPGALKDIVLIRGYAPLRH